MARKVKRTIMFSLGQVVQARKNSFNTQRQKIVDMREADFSKRVIDEGLTYTQQKEHWEEEIRLQKEKRVPDKAYISELETRVANFKKLERAEKFSNDYQDSFRELAEGMRSIQDHLDFLNQRLDNTTDVDLRSTINTKITEATVQKVTMEKTAFNNNVDFALKDKTEGVLNDMIFKVNDKIAKAQTAGDAEYESALNLSKQSLEQQLQQTVLGKQLIDNTIKTLTDPDPVSKLNSYNDLISSSDSKTPINVSGVQYDSVQSYWDAVKADYLGSGNFFNEINSFYTTQIDSQQIKDQDTLPVLVKNIKANLDELVGQPDFEPYATQLSNTIDLTVGYGVTKIGNNVVEDAKNDYNFGFASSQLTTLTNWSGIDITPAYQSLINEVANLQLADIQQINANIAEFQSKNPNAPFASALDFALRATPRTAVSPEELATTPAEEVITKTAEGEREDITIPPSPTPTPPAGFQVGGQSFVEGDLFKSRTSPTVYRVEGGKARPFVGQWTEPVFREQSGKSFADVSEVDDISGIQTGADITIQRATLQNPNDPNDKRVVDVGSQEASDLQSEGWGLV